MSRSVKESSILFCGPEKEKICGPEFKSDNPEEWQRYLKYARRNKKTVTVWCMCKGRPAPELLPRLKICYSDTKDVCWLAGWPYGGQLHHESCRFWSVWADGPQADIYMSDVVTAGNDGGDRIRLAAGLQKREAREPGDEPKATAARRPGGRRPSMSMLGLMHFIWEQAGINVWHPAFSGKRSVPWLTHRLDQVVQKIRAGGVPLAEVMLLPCVKDGPQRARNFGILRAAAEKNRRLVMVSRLARWSKEAEARLTAELPLGLFSGFPRLELPADVRTRIDTGYVRELAAWRAGGNVIFIAESEPPVTTFKLVNGRSQPSSSAEVIDVSLMSVSTAYIPLDSYYESVIEEKLRTEGRAFSKPLRYDGREEVLPDFLLNDVAGSEPVPMEVFGMNTEEYLARKAEKITYYDREYGCGNWWYWNAHSESSVGSVPDFPV